MTPRRRFAVLLLLLPVSAALADGHDASTIRYIPTKAIGATTVVFDGASFVTAWQAGAVFTARTDPATGATTLALPLAGVAEAAAAGYSTWMSNGLVAVQRGSRRLDVMEITTGTVTSLTHAASMPRVAKNGRAFMVVDATIYGGFPYAVTAFVYRDDGTLARKVTLPLSGEINYYDVQRAGDGFVVATAGDSGVHLFRFDASGTIASAQLLENPPNVQPRTEVSVAVTPDRTVVAWTSSVRSTIPKGYVSSVSASGQITRPEALPYSPSDSYEGACVLPIADGYAVLWNSTVPSGGQRTLACRLDAGGHVVAGTFTMLSDNQFLAAASSGDSIAIVTTPWPYVDLAMSVVPVPGNVDLRTRGTAHLTVPVTQTQVQLASDGAGFLAVWVEHEGESTVTRLARVSRSGEPLDGEGIKLPLPPKPPLSLTITRGAPGEALIVAATSSGIYALRWSRSVGLLDAAPIPIELRTTEGDNTVVVAWSEGRYLLVSRGNIATLTGTFIGRDGSVSAPIELPISRPRGALNGYAVAAALAWSGHDFLLAAGIVPFRACQNICANRPEEIWLVRLSARGTVVDAPVAVPGRHSVARLASSGSNFLLALDDGTLRMVTTGSAGINVGPELRLFPSFGDAASDVVWDGHAYVVVWRYGIPFDGPAWLGHVRVDTAGNMSPPEIVSALRGTPSAPSAAVNDAGETAAAVTELTPWTATERARVYLASDFSVPPPPRRVRSVRP